MKMILVVVLFVLVGCVSARLQKELDSARAELERAKAVKVELEAKKKALEEEKAQLLAADVKDTPEWREKWERWTQRYAQVSDDFASAQEAYEAFAEAFALKQEEAMKETGVAVGDQMADLATLLFKTLGVAVPILGAATIKP